MVPHGSFIRLCEHFLRCKGSIWIEPWRKREKAKDNFSFTSYMFPNLIIKKICFPFQFLFKEHYGLWVTPQKNQPQEVHFFSSEVEIQNKQGFWFLKVKSKWLYVGSTWWYLKSQQKWSENPGTEFRKIFFLCSLDNCYRLLYFEAMFYIFKTIFCWSLVLQFSWEPNKTMNSDIC